MAWDRDLASGMGSACALALLAYTVARALGLLSWRGTTLHPPSWSLWPVWGLLQWRGRGLKTAGAQGWAPPAPHMLQ